MKIDFYETNIISDSETTFVVIVSKHDGKWVLVRHRDRSTWEIPGSHREEGEAAFQAAERELFEETGAKRFNLTPVCSYSVLIADRTSLGKLFYSDIYELGPLPEMEIVEIKLVDDILNEDLTYPAIQPILLSKVDEFLE